MAELARGASGSSAGLTSFDGDVLALDITGFLEALAECTHTVRDRVKRCGVEKSYDRHRRLPRARREGPYGRAADKRDEFAPFSCGHPKLGNKRCIR